MNTPVNLSKRKLKKLIKATTSWLETEEAQEIIRLETERINKILDERIEEAEHNEIRRV